MPLLAVVSAIVFVTQPQRASADADCPCSLFSQVTPPGEERASNDNTTYTLGVRFTPETDGYITSVKFFRSASASGTHKGTLWDGDGNLIATGQFSNLTTSGWQTMMFDQPVSVDKDSVYTASYTTTNWYMSTQNFFGTTQFEASPLRALSVTDTDNSGGAGNGVYAQANNEYPRNTINGSNYWVDVDFVSANDMAPQVVGVTPLDMSHSVDVMSPISATFTAALDMSTVTDSTVVLSREGNRVAVDTIDFDAATRKLTITPGDPLQPNTQYTVTIKGGANGVTGQSGLPLASDYSWSFMTGAHVSCPCSGFDFQAPGASATPVNDSQLTVGVVVRVAKDGFLSAVRYYQPLFATASTNKVSIYTTSGTYLGSGTSIERSASGWQETRLDTPVPVSAGQTYVVATHRSDGTYVHSKNLTDDVGNGPIQVVKDTSRYAYGPNQFPNNIAAPGVNYWIDAVFTEASTYSPEFTTVSTQPDNASFGNVPNGPNKPITVSVTAPVDTATVPGAIQVTTAQGQQVTGTTTYDADQRMLVFTPTSQLDYSTRYTATISSDLKDVYGTRLSGAHLSFTFSTGAKIATALNNGKGGPILVVTNTDNKFSEYIAEILRSEGINYFTVKDITEVNASLLNKYKYVFLGSGQPSRSQVAAMTKWVQRGGGLVAFRPDARLAPLLGVSRTGGYLNDGYIKIDTSAAPGKGIINESIQYHDSADLYTLSGAKSVATLYSDANTATPNPGATIRNVGDGYAASFTYDLPKSIVLLHQGNPDWAENTNGVGQIVRPDSLFRKDTQTDWLNIDKAYIPQADEQQRLLVNMLTYMSTESTKSGPTPHYWYLPYGYKAALQMALDDHSTNGGTAESFARIDLSNAKDCSVDAWTCARSGSLMYVYGGPTAGQTTLFNKFRYSMGVHVNTNCESVPAGNLRSIYTAQLGNFAATHSNVSPQTFGRTHCFAWTGWADTAKVNEEFGIRYSMEYVWFPPSWTGSRIGLLSGSAQTMRFADDDGTMINVYNAPTDLDYETDATDSSMSRALANATGSYGFYGTYGTHYDFSNSYQEKLQSTAAQYGVPMIGADQALAWKDAQSSSTFTIISSTPKKVVFKPRVAEGGVGMVAMMPAKSSTGELKKITVDGNTVPYHISSIKGVDYALFDAQIGTYTAVYMSEDTTGGSNSASPGPKTSTKNKKGQKKSANKGESLGNPFASGSYYATIFPSQTSGTRSQDDTDSSNQSTSEGSMNNSRDSDTLQQDAVDSNSLTDIDDGRRDGRWKSWFWKIIGFIGLATAIGIIWWLVAARRRRRGE